MAALRLGAVALAAASVGLCGVILAAHPGEQSVLQAIYHHRSILAIGMDVDGGQDRQDKEVEAHLAGCR
ncbi:uncharacterized protein BJX67DRAFT_347472 [Aspergillus lucknowensis]|uniref:Uncharacterized protein n=1 Tax=Aspergillus lucknowensis TaxID=176173 RepID=A0ABR4LYA0_9EURO